MRRAPSRSWWVAVAALVGALALGVGAAGAGGGGTLGLTVFPTTLLPGGPGWAFVTFTNPGPSTLTHVVVNVDLGGGTLVSSTPALCSATSGGASCALGNVAKGGSVQLTIAFTASGDAGSSTVSASATWNAKTVGKPKGDPASGASPSVSQDITVVAPSDTVLGLTGGCVAPDGTVSSDGIDVTGGSPPAGLPCQPLVVGATSFGTSEEGTDCSALFAKVPEGTAAQATLTFADGCLPWPENQAGTDPPEGFDSAAGYWLYENPDFPNAGTDVVVPACNGDGSIPGATTVETDRGTFSTSTDACVASVSASDLEDGDFDAGSIVVNLVGGPGDGQFHG